MNKIYKVGFLESLARAFRSTWNAIASDVYAVVSNPDDSDIIEMCIDADRLRQFCLVDDIDMVTDFYAMSGDEQMILSKLIVQDWA